MGLTLEIEHRLKGKSFDLLYAENADKWVEMASKAREYTESCIGEGENARHGDVSKNLQNGIEIDPDFESHLKEKKLTQKYWVRYFSDYILEQIYPSHLGGHL